jgi:peptidoglycan/xylan/chitin deacetylase (PgdA/CDA1 family)
MAQATCSDRTPWPMPPFVRASIGWHLLAAGASLAMPERAGWALAGIALTQALITAAGLWPRSRLLGPNVTRLPAPCAARNEIALTIDDGPDPEVTPAVLGALAQADARATFFCIAERARAQPALLREIVARGHDVQNHSDKHRLDFALLGARRIADEVERAQTALEALSGQRPSCFRAPAGLRNPFLDPTLHRLGLHLVSWTRRGFDTRERDGRRVLSRLTRELAAGDILLLHDGHAARDARGRAVVLDVLPRLLEHCRSAGLRFVTLAQALPPRRPTAAA